ncbi:uncharacterized protein LOC109610045 isoform X2 [Camponotus floridanus]|uniref:uncharacterized protein LOC109610045 isoform X2 n=1 Tax=Camponotus floridanus TaxID=104421 RepID=UPI000DC6A767|nr:uncharacterized protein LOC109610045 isoform X2 [Camponotus floridanus]
MQYFVIIFNDFCNLVPANWVNIELKKVFWPPKHVKFNKHKMHLLQPNNDDWLTYDYRKCLGPFESLEIANQVEEYCINVSTNEDTDETCNKALKSNVETKRKRKRPKRLSDTDEDEVIKDNSDTDNNSTRSFILPLSDYQLQNFNEFIPESISMGNNMLVTEDCNESKNEIEEKFSCDSTSEHEQENTGTATTTTTTLQKQSKLLTYSGKKTFVVKVPNVDGTHNLPRPSERCTTGNTTYIHSNKNRPINNDEERTQERNYIRRRNADVEIVNTRRRNADVEIVNPARNTQNRPGNNDRERIQERNHALSEPMTEERFLPYFKCLKNKMNHLINLMRDRGIEVENEENLLPNFPLRTVLELEQFEMHLVKSSEIQKQYIREIQMIGGSDPGKFTRATLRFLMSDKLAVQYSWSGQRRTIQFKSTLISQLIVETVSKVKNASRSDIEIFIKKWLQHASDRIKNKK